MLFIDNRANSFSQRNSISIMNNVKVNHNSSQNSPKKIDIVRVSDSSIRNGAPFGMTDGKSSFAVAPEKSDQEQEKAGSGVKSKREDYNGKKFSLGKKKPIEQTLTGSLLLSSEIKAEHRYHKK